MTKFEVTSVQGGYIISYWMSSSLKMKSEVYSNCTEVLERMGTLIPGMEEE